MNNEQTTPEPANPDPTRDCGGRRPSSCSPQDDFVGLLFMPLFWAGNAMVIISVIFEVWSPVCFVAGALISTAIRDAIEAVNKDDEANDQGDGRRDKTPPRQ